MWSTRLWPCWQFYPSCCFQRASGNPFRRPWPTENSTDDLRSSEGEGITFLFSLRPIQRPSCPAWTACLRHRPLILITRVGGVGTRELGGTPALWHGRSSRTLLTSWVSGVHRWSLTHVAFSYIKLHTGKGLKSQRSHAFIVFWHKVGLSSHWRWKIKGLCSLVVLRLLRDFENRCTDAKGQNYLL